MQGAASGVGVREGDAGAASGVGVREGEAGMMGMKNCNRNVLYLAEGNTIVVE